MKSNRWRLSILGNSGETAGGVADRVNSLKVIRKGERDR